jgi:hypothetical protein
MANVKKAQGGKKLTVARVRQVADSLNKVGNKKIAAGALSRIASEETRNSLIKGGSKDVENSERYKKLADKAEGKKPSMKKGGNVTKAKAGKEMIKRADGSYSQRGLWDNIRANKGSGKKPTAQMLKQEKKIKAKGK